MTSDIWSDRVNKNFEDPFLDTPMMRRRKFTSEEITALCVAKSLDASDSKAPRYHKCVCGLDEFKSMLAGLKTTSRTILVSRSQTRIWRRKETTSLLGGLRVKEQFFLHAYQQD